MRKKNIWTYSIGNLKDITKASSKKSVRFLSIATENPWWNHGCDIFDCEIIQTANIATSNLLKCTNKHRERVSGAQGPPSGLVALSLSPWLRKKKSDRHSFDQPKIHREDMEPARLRGRLLQTWFAGRDPWVISGGSSLQHSWKQAFWWDPCSISRCHDFEESDRSRNKSCNEQPP